MRKSFLNRVIKQVSTIGVGAGAIVSFLSDFLIPIAPFALWIGIVSLFLISLLSLARLTIPKLKPSPESDGIWFAPIAISGFLFSTICLSTYYLSSQFKDLYGNEIGVLSGNSDIIKQFQEQTILLDRIADTQEASLVEQKSINQNTKSMADTQKLSLAEQQSINRNTQSIADTQMSSLTEQKSINQSTKNIETASYFSFQSLNEALISGDLEKIKHFKEEGKDLYIVNNKASEFSTPMIINMIHENHRNPEEILDYLVEIGAISLNEEHDLNQNTSIKYLPFWQKFIESTSNIDKHILAGDSFNVMKKDMGQNYGYILPSNLESKYQTTSPVGSERYISGGSDYLYAGAWLHGSPSRLQVTLYSAALVAKNQKAKSKKQKAKSKKQKAKQYLESRNSKSLGYFTMPSQTKIMIDTRFL